MKLFYFLSRYVSHFKAGREYLKCLISPGVEIVDNLESADIVIIHDEPPTYPLYFNKFRILKKKYVIGYTVWETDILPDIYIKGLQLLNEIWTCSEYTYGTIKNYFERVFKIPHVVPRYKARDDKIVTIKERLDYSEDKYYFYTIVDSINPRKNLPATIYSFSKIFPSLDERVFLVVKQYRQSLTALSYLPNLIRNRLDEIMAL